MFKKPVLIFLCSNLIFFYFPVCRLSAEENGIKKTEEIQALERETAKITAEKDLETAKKDLEKVKLDRVKQLIPDLPSKNENNTFTIGEESQDFEATILALRSLDTVVEPVIEELLENIPNIELAKSSIIFETDGIQESVISYLQYKEFEAVIKNLDQDYSDLNIKFSDPAGFAPAGISAATGLLFDLIPLFTTNVEFKKATVDVSSDSFIAKLIHKIKSDETLSNLSFYYPQKYPLYSIEEAENILARIRNIEELKSRAELIIKVKNREINNKKITNEEKKKLKEEIEKISAVNKATEEFLDSFKSDISNANSGNNNGNMSKIMSILQGQKINNLKKEGSIFYLTLDVSGGGSVKTVRNFFFKKRRINSGSIVNYYLYNDSSQIVNANEHIRNTGFVKVPKITSVLETE